MRIGHVEFDPAALEEVCRRRQIVELEIFGSALRDEFRSESDVDLLATFAPGARRSLFELVRVERELSNLFHRRVDLVEKDAVVASANPIRRRAILEGARRVYAA